MMRHHPSQQAPRSALPADHDWRAAMFRLTIKLRVRGVTEGRLLAGLPTAWRPALVPK